MYEFCEYRFAAICAGRENNERRSSRLPPPQFSAIQRTAVVSVELERRIGLVDPAKLHMSAGELPEGFGQFAACLENSGFVNPTEAVDRKEQIPARHIRLGVFPLAPDPPSGADFPVVGISLTRAHQHLLAL